MDDIAVLEKELKTEEEKPHYLGHRKRLKDRFLASKKGTLPDYELLEILLFAATPRGDVKPLSKELITKFGSFAKVISASAEDLMKVRGINDSVIAQFKVVQESVERLLKQEVLAQTVLQSWKALVDYCRVSMGQLKKEQFRILFLNKKNVLISDELQEAGTVDQTPVYPREVVKRALELEASAVILVHNHPSGDLTPSKADINVTRQIQQGLEIVGITLHDHIIVSAADHYSFKTYGLI